MQSNNVLVTGADGQLGQCFRLLVKSYKSINFFFCNSADLNISDSVAVETFLKNNQIQVLINCAAYTAVDKAEEDKEKSLLINAQSVGSIADVCKKLGVKLIHFSTDYVFDGNASRPYHPYDNTDPVNFYGFTKLKGERKILNSNPEALIIRTSWVYSPFGKNFVKTMQYLLSNKEELSVVADQFGSPTYAVDLANAVLKIIIAGTKCSGTYHYCNAGIISWFDFATAIRTGIKSDCIIHPITTAEFPTPAKRPAYSALDTESFKNDFNQLIPDWQTSLMACLQLQGN